MTDSAHARHKYVIHPLVCEPCHVAVDELHGIAGLAAGMFLRKRHDLFARVRRENHVVTELRKELIRQREETVEHKAARDADGLLRGVALRAVALEEEFLRPRIESAVERHLLLVGLLSRTVAAGQVEALERRAREPRLGGLLGGHERRAHRAGHGEVRAHRHGVAPERAERLDDGRVVRHAALKHDTLAHVLGAHDAVQVVAHDGERQASGDVGLARACGQRRVYRRLDKDGAALAEVDGGRGGKRERAVVADGDAESGRLLLDEGARARRADLVHLEVHDLPRAQRDVLGVLPADLEHGVYLRVRVGCARRLARDLVDGGVGTHELGHKPAA